MGQKRYGNFRNGTHRPFADVGTKNDIEYPTYRELIKDLPKLFEEHRVNEINVTRQLRGEWGQRFEHWRISEGKPYITKEGWY